MRWIASFIVLFGICNAVAEEPGHVMTVDGAAWLKTITPTYDDSTDELRQDTNKVYTQVYDFSGEYFVTKGLGGKYPHHRGLFIGWQDTKVGDKTYNTWVQTDHYQVHVDWINMEDGAEEASASQVIDWRDAKTHAPFIRERRTVRAKPGQDGIRIIDFTSTLMALDSDIELRGDLHHAGMQIRLANEVSEHEETTEYTLPEGTELREGNGVAGAWWALCSAQVRGQRVWMMHMTPPDHPAGAPVYSIRPYGRFGAFTEPNLSQGKPLTLTYRIIMSPEELTKADCDKLYQQYSDERNQ